MSELEIQMLRLETCLLFETGERSNGGEAVEKQIRRILIKWSHPLEKCVASLSKT